MSLEIQHQINPQGEQNGEFKKEQHFSADQQHHSSHHNGETTTLSMSKQQHNNVQHQQQPQPQQSIHQFDMTIMKRFYESCVGKLEEQSPKWKPAEWLKPKQGQQQQTTISESPSVFSEKQRVIDAFTSFVRESGEPMILLPNFDYSDVMNFERFLQYMKQDGINAIRKYKQYVSNKDMRKFEVDLVVFHARYGILLLECKECDHLDMKRRSKARMQLTSARNCFESLSRLMLESKGGIVGNEGPIPITELIALPNVLERPLNSQQQQELRLQKEQQATPLQTPGGSQNQSASSQGSNSSGSSSSGRIHRTVNFLIKSDLESSATFAKWWSQSIVEQFNQHQQLLEAAKKPTSFNPNLLNMLSGLISCVRHNSIMPVVYQETDSLVSSSSSTSEREQPQQGPQPEHSSETTTTPVVQEPALKVYAEFFQAEHEAARTLPKCVVHSTDAEKLRKAVCLQTLWLLLNDAQKKISVVCSEQNKPHYEEFFTQQRKMYNNLNNVRFYSDLHACTVTGQHHTSKKDSEVWIFDAQINGTLGEVLERAKELSSFWIFTNEKQPEQLEQLHARHVNLDASTRSPEQQRQELELKPWLSGLGCGRNLKMPLRLHCDLLVIGDIVSAPQLKMLYHYLKSQNVPNQTHQYQQEQQGGSQSRNNYNNNQNQYQLHFNPVKRFKSIKFIRGGTIDNLRTALQMHDAIRAPVILMHVGDEDVFKTRSATTTVDRIKELTGLVKEYCPDSFLLLSTLMRRMSKSENVMTNEVNKSIVNFCKQTKETTTPTTTPTMNVHYMLNNNCDPDYHTYEGRSLSNKGLKVYTNNLLFAVDYFLVKKNKQN